MKKTKPNSTLLALAALILISTPLLQAENGGATFRIGYLFADEDDNLGVNQGTFNLYEGLSVSFEDFRYSDSHGFGYTAHLSDITKNSHSGLISVYKPGLFSLSVNNNQYRRRYGPGSDFTRRRSTGAKATLQPIKGIKLFGGFNTIRKKGTVTSFYRPESNSRSYKNDFETDDYNFGLQYYKSGKSIRFEYRGHHFFDELDKANDRKAGSFNAVGSMRVPNHEWITISAGFFSRTDELYEIDMDIKSNQFWTGTRLYFHDNLTFDGRLTFATTERSSDLSETSNNSFMGKLGKTWPKKANLSLGYESRITDDDQNRTSSGAILLSGWCRPTDKLYFRAKITSRKKTVDEGVTLTGEESVTYHKVTASYKFDQYGTVSAQWYSRSRDNQDIGSKADYDGLSSNWELTLENFATINLTYSYYKGIYENEAESFEFADHAISAGFYPVEFSGLRSGLNGTYYRSRRDHDLEKFSMGVHLAYEFIKAHHLEVKYKVYTYDDLRIVEDTYTANIVEVNLIKDIEI